MDLILYKEMLSLVICLLFWIILDYIHTHTHIWWVDGDNFQVIWKCKVYINIFCFSVLQVSFLIWKCIYGFLCIHAVWLLFLVKQYSNKFNVLSVVNSKLHRRKFNPEAGELSVLSSVGKQRDALNRPISSDSYVSIILFSIVVRYITKYTLSNIKHVILIHYKMNFKMILILKSLETGTLTSASSWPIRTLLLYATRVWERSSCVAS